MYLHTVDDSVQSHQSQIRERQAVAETNSLNSDVKGVPRILCNTSKRGQGAPGATGRKKQQGGKVWQTLELISPTDAGGFSSFWNRRFHLELIWTQIQSHLVLSKLFSGSSDNSSRSSGSTIHQEVLDLYHFSVLRLSWRCSPGALSWTESLVDGPNFGMSTTALLVLLSAGSVFFLAGHVPLIRDCAAAASAQGARTLRRSTWNGFWRTLRSCLASRSLHRRDVWDGCFDVKEFLLHQVLSYPASAFRQTLFSATLVSSSLRNDTVTFMTRCPHCRKALNLPTQHQL